MSGDEGEKAKGGGGGGGGEYGTFQGPPSYPPPRPPVVGYPQPVPPPGLYGQPPAEPYSRHRGGYQAVPAQDYEAGVRGHSHDRLPCCGIGIGWFLFIIGFFLGAIPWYVGAFLLWCSSVDYREKPGYVACTIATVETLIRTAHMVLSSKSCLEKWLQEVARNGLLEKPKAKDTKKPKRTGLQPAVLATIAVIIGATAGAHVY